MATTASAVINTTDTGAGTPTVPDASVTTKWQEYIWIRHLEATNTNKAKIYVWNPNASSDSSYLKWQEVASAGAFSDLTGTATIAQLPTGITVSNLSIDGAITNTHLAGGITNTNLAGSIIHNKITSVNASAVTSVSGSKIPVNTIPTGITNADIDNILGSASVDWDKLNIADADIPGAKIKDSLVHGQIESVSADTVTTGFLPPARLEYMFERNLPILNKVDPSLSGTANLHTILDTDAFEGIIRLEVVANTNEVIIALPNPAMNAYVGKAAKLSIYRGSHSEGTGNVTIQVCESGTDSSSFASNKIIDNNNGEITDKVVILPEIETEGGRKVVVDLVCDSKATGSSDDGDGQWIITGGAPVTGKGVASVAGISVGQDNDAVAKNTVTTVDIITTGKTTVSTNNLGSGNATAAKPKWATTAEVDTWQVDTGGSGYDYGERLKIDNTEANVTTQVEFFTTGVDSDNTTTGWLFMLKLAESGRGVFSAMSGETYAERIYPLTTIVGNGTGGKVQVKFRGIRPDNVAIGELWYDPWGEKVRIRAS